MVARTGDGVACCRNDIISIRSGICATGRRSFRFDTQLDGTGVLYCLVFGIGATATLHRMLIAVGEYGKRLLSKQHNRDFSNSLRMATFKGSGGKSNTSQNGIQFFRARYLDRHLLAEGCSHTETLTIYAKLSKSKLTKSPQLRRTLETKFDKGTITE